jgi:hypothetical protein
MQNSSRQRYCLPNSDPDASTRCEGTTLPPLADLVYVYAYHPSSHAHHRFSGRVRLPSLLLLSPTDTPHRNCFVPKCHSCPVPWSLLFPVPSRFMFPVLSSNRSPVPCCQLAVAGDHPAEASPHHTTVWRVATGDHTQTTTTTPFERSRCQ